MHLNGISELYNKKIINNNTLDLYEAKNDCEKIAKNIFLVRKGIEPSENDFPIEDNKNSKNEEIFGMEKASPYESQNTDKDAFPLEGTQKYVKDIQNSVQINNENNHNNNNNFNNNYNTPGIAVSQQSNPNEGDNNHKSDKSNENEYDDFVVEKLDDDDI